MAFLTWLWKRVPRIFFLRKTDWVGGTIECHDCGAITPVLFEKDGDLPFTITCPKCGESVQMVWD
jgi:hypothetical protein